MNLLSRLELAFKALLQLGPTQLVLYGLYQVGLRTGHYQRLLSASLARLDDVSQTGHFVIYPCLPALPERTSLLEVIGEAADQLYSEANEIVNGKVCLFGGKPVLLDFGEANILQYWTKYETGNILPPDQDIKLIWEPARFGWACKLAMAYYLSRDERYAEAFWQNTGRFMISNLPYDGPNWSSAQEVAIRLVAMVFAIQIFIQSKHSTPARIASLAQAIAVHAERIPPTMVYARSQNNNHLLIEALGLYTASAALPEHPMAPKWHRLGWKWLIHAFRSQISPDGTYIQHSTNYHRLILQAALWAFAVHDHSFSTEVIPSDIISRLEAATRWLWKLVDPESGHAPNLGHHDGAYILPVSVCPSNDYRPVIQAAALRFLHTHITPQGAWEDMARWLGIPREQGSTEAGMELWHQDPPPAELNSHPPYVLVNHKNGSWATLRVATFRARPAHADQLHLDLWWRGENIAQDPGTYRYNAPEPWENSMTSALVHNTVVIDNQEFMLRAGKFLYLDWAQAKLINYQPGDQNNPEILTAEHSDYRKLGIMHTRKVTISSDGRWEIIDQVDGPASPHHTVRLHWLLPDWQYEVLGPITNDSFSTYEIRIRSPQGWISLKTGASTQGVPLKVNYQLARAGTILFGSGDVLPIVGWVSPIYGEKIPALASICVINSALPVTLRTEWILPSES